MNKTNIKTIVVTILGVILFGIITMIAGAYSGIPDVAATTPEGRLMSWFMNTTKDHSIRSRAQNITAPALNDSTLIAAGFAHYNEMCVTCHGAPGKKPDELAQGLNPLPPNLAQSTRDLDPAEMFVIVKSGIKMTGMPGFGSTHNDSAVWAMVAFLKRLQTMSPEDYAGYQQMQTKQNGEESGDHHDDADQEHHHH